MKYKSVPKEVEATQWDLDDRNNDVKLEVVEVIPAKDDENKEHLVVHAFMETGDDEIVSVVPGDWIVKDGKNTLVMADEVFESSYKLMRGQSTAKAKSKSKAGVTTPKTQLASGRSKACDQPGCDNNFVDESKTNTRRYCDEHRTQSSRLLKNRKKLCAVCKNEFVDTSPANRVKICGECKAPQGQVSAKKTSGKKGDLQFEYDLENKSYYYHPPGSSNPIKFPSYHAGAAYLQIKFPKVLKAYNAFYAKAAKAIARGTMSRDERFQSRIDGR